MHIAFSKYAGCGNDFIMIDNRSSFFPIQNQEFINKLCQRCTGIGADGLILLESSVSADFKMRIFNADGKETEMCGNGIRCLFKFIQELGFKENKYTIETMHRCLVLIGKEDNVCVEMGNPVDMRWNLSLSNRAIDVPIHFLNTGVPHAVFFTNSLESLDMFQIGKELRHHEAFAPLGANVNAASFDAQGNMMIRTYERGVENETLACGTGATAAAIAAARIKGIKSPVKVYPRSKEVLEVGFRMTGDAVTDVTLTGPATLIFKGMFQAF